MQNFRSIMTGPEFTLFLLICFFMAIAILSGGFLVIALIVTGKITFIWVCFLLSGSIIIMGCFATMKQVLIDMALIADIEK